MEGIPPTHVFNYDESPVKDDPGAEDTFFAKKAKYHEQVPGTVDFGTVPRYLYRYWSRYLEIIGA